MALNKLHKKDFSIAIKHGSDSGAVKFKKEATKGELFFDTFDKKLYIASTDAGSTDAILYNTDAFTLTPAPFSNNYSLELDGGDDYATIGTTYSALSGNKSISGWFYFDSVATRSIFAPVGASGFSAQGWFILNASSIRFKAGSTLHTFTVPTLSTGAWYHLAVTGDGTDLKLYINGTQQGGNKADGDWSIGEFFRTSNFYYFDGKVDEIGLWTGTTLTSSEVQSIANISGASGDKAVDLDDYTGLTHWWRFGDGGDTTTVTDNKGSNNLTLAQASNFIGDTP